MENEISHSEEYNLTDSELFFLASYQIPRRLLNHPFLELSHWQSLLGNDPEVVAKRFLDLGFLEFCDLGTTAILSLTKNEIANYLRSLGLQTTGNKDALILRALVADPEGLANLIGTAKLARCTKLGIRIMEQKQAERSTSTENSIQMQSLPIDSKATGTKKFDVLKRIRFFAATLTSGVVTGVTANYFFNFLESLGEYESSISEKRSFGPFIPDSERISDDLIDELEKYLPGFKEDKKFPKPFQDFIEAAEKCKEGKSKLKRSIIQFFTNIVFLIALLRLTRLINQKSYEDMFELGGLDQLSDMISCEWEIGYIIEVSTLMNLERFPRWTKRKVSAGTKLQRNLIKLMKLVKEEDDSSWGHIKSKSNFLQLGNELTEDIGRIVRIVKEPVLVELFEKLDRRIKDIGSFDGNSPFIT